MEESKKPKRPRIGESQELNAESGHFEKVTYNPNSSYSSEQSRGMGSEGAEASENKQDYRRSYNQNYNQRGYSNPYNRNNGYNNRGNNRQGGYGNNSYGSRQEEGYNQNYGQQGGYNNRQGGYSNNRQGGYGENRQGGYNNRQGGYGNQQGGYGENRQGGYNNNRQGGYNNRQGGFNNNRQGGYGNQQGGYGNNRQGGFNNNRQGGYGNQQGGYNNNRQGGFNNNRQGGYGNQQGGYNNNRQGGFNNNRQGNFNRQGGQRFTPRPKQIVYEMPEIDPNEEIRLNKFMANAGICSRREADDLIQQGLVMVNGVAVTELGTKIKREDVVEYKEQVVTLENKCYILLNKPKDCVTTSDDPDGRLTVMDIVKNACKERIYPVGRLDRNTTGVLLLTNDGDLASKLTHPKYVKKKIYHVWTDKNIEEDDMQRLADGIELEDGPIHADAISYVNDHDKNQAGIEIHSGRNRIVRRMFESLGYRVTKLDRVYFAGLTKKNLPRGRWRYLTQEEVNFLKMGSFE